jgi:hypothetical protein
VSQAREAMLPSESVEPSVKVTAWPVWGLAGAKVKAAVGGALGGGGGGAPAPRRTQRATEGTPSAVSGRAAKLAEGPEAVLPRRGRVPRTARPHV